MVTNEEINVFRCGIPSDLWINIEKAADDLCVEIDEIIRRLYDAFFHSKNENIKILHLRYETAWHDVVTEFFPEVEKQKAYKMFEREVDVASMENMIDFNNVCRLNTDGLPNFNYIKLFEHMLSSPSYYKEAIFQTALQTIAGIVLKVPYAYTRDIHGNRFEAPLYTNLYTLCMLKAGSSKTTVYRTGRHMISKARGDVVFLPVSPSPELLKKKLATELVEVRPNRKTNEMEEKHFSYAGDKNYAGWRVMWDEECGMYWESFKKAYMTGSSALLCSLFSNIYEGKGNVGDDGSTSDYLCDDPYFGMNMYTTPSSMRMLDTMHILNGFLPRHATVIGEYDTPLPETSGIDIDIDKEIDMFVENKTTTDKDREMEKRKRAVEKASEIIAAVLDPSKYKDGKFEVQLHEQCYQLIIDWEINMRKALKNNPTLTVLRGRNFEICYKLAILITIGNIPYYIIQKDSYTGDISHNCAFEDVKNLDALVERLAYFTKEKIMGYKLKRLVVPPDAMRFALKIMDEIYFPHSVHATQSVMVDYEDPDTEKVMNLLERSEKITKEELLKLKSGIKEGYKMMYLERQDGAMKEDKALSIANIHAEKMIDMISEFSDDCELTYITQKKLWDSARRHFTRVERVLETLVKCNNIIPVKAKFGKSDKPTTAYVYIKGSRTPIVMPERNYVGYTGNGKYWAGVEFEKVEGKPETSESGKEPVFATKENVAARIAGLPASVGKPEDSDDSYLDGW